MSKNQDEKPSWVEQTEIVRESMGMNTANYDAETGEYVDDDYVPGYSPYVDYGSDDLNPAFVDRVIGAADSGNSDYSPTGAGSDYYMQVMRPDDQQALKMWGAAYNLANNQNQKDYAHQMAEEIRAKYGYSGGTDGSEYIKVETPTAQYTQPWQTGKTGSFSYGSAPTYTDPYASRIDAMLNQVLNRQDFSYNAEQDDLYQQYKKQYNREGQRAMQDTLGQVAARTGGLASSYATTAAQQANQYYAQQLADKIPELYQLAYEMYLDDIDLKVQDLGLLQSVSDTAYNRYRDTMSDWRNDRDFAYGVYRDDIADDQWQTSFDRDVFESDRSYDYGVSRDKVEDARYDQEWAHQVAQDALAQSNWEKEFNQANSQWAQEYALKKAAASGSGSSGSSGYKSSGSSGSKSGSSGSKKSSGNGYVSQADLTKQSYKNNTGSKSGSSTAAYAGMELGLGPTNAQFIQELSAYGGIQEQSNGKFKWSPGWSASNYQKKLAEAKSYNPFGSILSIL